MRCIHRPLRKNFLLKNQITDRVGVYCRLSIASMNDVSILMVVVQK